MIPHHNWDLWWVDNLTKVESCDWGDKILDDALSILRGKRL